MKTLIILVTLLTAGPAWALTWEGVLDPNEFDQWEWLSVNPTSLGFVWVLIKNPDRTSPIDAVAMQVGLNSTVLSYRYFEYGEPYSYMLDINQNKYVRHHFTLEQKKSCMKCHSGKLVPKASI